MTTGAWILIAAALAAVGFGLSRALRDGRFRGAAAADRLPDPRRTESTVSTDAPEPTVRDRVLEAVPTARFGSRATLVQFSSAFCAPCRATRTVLGAVADAEDGVVHVEVDAEQHLDLVRALDVRRTPTTIIVGPTGQELGRAAGAPRREQVLAALPHAGVSGS